MKLLALLILLFAFNVYSQPMNQVEKLEKIYAVSKKVTDKYRSEWRELYTLKNRGSDISQDALDSANDRYNKAQSEELYFKDKLGDARLKSKNLQK